MSTPAGSISRDSVRTLGFGIISASIALLTGIILAKALGPQGKGDYSLLQLMQAGVSAPTAGIGMSIVFQLTKMRRTLADLFRPLLLMGAVACTLVWIALAVWGAIRGANLPVVVFAATAPAVVLLAWQAPTFLGLGWLRRLNVQGLALTSLMLVAAAAAIYVLHLNTPGALWSWSICQWIIALSIIVQCAPLARGPQTETVSDELRQLLQYGWKSGLGATLNYLNYRVDSIAIIAMLGVGGFGIYSIAVTASELLFRISGSIGAAITKRVGSSTPEVAAATLAKANRASVAVVGAGAIVLFFIAPLVVPLFYGGRFAPAIPAMRILLPGVVLFSSVSIMSSYFSYQMGRPAFMLYMSITGIVIEAAGCWTLVPRFGINGAALASTLTYVVAAIANTVYFQRVTGVALRSIWVPTVDEFKTLWRLLPTSLPFGRA